MEYNEERLRRLIRQNRWMWAASEQYRACPHSYVVRRTANMTNDDWVFFVESQREFGIHEKFGSYNFPYLHIDGYKYWTMGAPIPETIIINRQKLFGEFDDVEYQFGCLRDYETNQKMRKIIEATGATNFYEIGAGDGSLLDIIDVSPSNYQAVEPSKNAVSEFRKKRIGFYQKIRTKSFEEDYDRWSKIQPQDENICFVALYGSPSYIMPEYLNIFRGRKFVFMFYEEGFTPKEFAETHHFNYSHGKIKNLLGFETQIWKMGNYYVCFNYPLDIPRMFQTEPYNFNKNNE